VNFDRENPKKNSHAVTTSNAHAASNAHVATAPNAQVAHVTKLCVLLL